METNRKTEQEFEASARSKKKGNGDKGWKQQKKKRELPAKSQGLAKVQKGSKEAERHGRRKKKEEKGL